MKNDWQQDKTTDPNVSTWSVCDTTMLRQMDRQTEFPIPKAWAVSKTGQYTDVHKILLYLHFHGNNLTSTTLKTTLVGTTPRLKEDHKIC